MILGALMLSGCAFIPIQDRTLANDKGGSVTCKQVGAGAFSYWIGKARYNNCIKSAQSQGYQ
jgi:hypothetical protein